MRLQLRPVVCLAALGIVAGSLLACVTSDFHPRLLTALPGTGSLGSAPDPDKFTFYVFGDNRPDKKDDPPTKTIQDIVNAIKAANPQPAFALSAGDMIHGKDPTDKPLIEQQYNDVLAVFQQAGVPIHNAPGNHETDDKDDLPNATMTQWYEELIGPAFASFDYGNSHFIALNSEEVAPPLTPRSLCGSEDCDPGFIAQDQLDWLDQDLWAHQSAQHVFLFMHHSLHAHQAINQLDADSAKAVTKILSKYSNVTAVFSAHEHLYFNPQSPNDITNPMAGPNTFGPRFLVTGGAGAKLSGSAGPLAFHHYLIVSVDHGTVSIQLVKLP